MLKIINNKINIFILLVIYLITLNKYYNVSFTLSHTHTYIYYISLKGVRKFKTIKIDLSEFTNI